MSIRLREVEVTPPHFDSVQDFLEYSRRRDDPQAFIDRFVSSLKGVKPSVAPTYDARTAAAGSARIAAGLERIRIGDKGIIRDSELFKTIFHEEVHLRIAAKARAGVWKPLELFTGPRGVEEDYAEKVANRYYRRYVRAFGPFSH